MDWPLVIAWALFAFGLVAGGFIFARSPSFWITFATLLFRKAWPLIWAEISRRKSPEDEAAWREEQRGGIKPPPGTGVTTPKTITQPGASRTKRDMK